MVKHENESIYRQIEQQWAMEQLAKENDNLKRLLLLNHDFTSTLEERMKEIEEQEREEELQRFRMLKLKEEVEQKLRDSLALAEKARLEEEERDKSLDG